MAKKTHTQKELGKLFSFHSYSHFPFTHGGEIVCVRENGSVELKEYGHGFYFKNIHMLPLKEGQELCAKLKLLERDYNAALSKFRLEWFNKAAELAPFIKDSK
jgi:hypothetical protein